MPEPKKTMGKLTIFKRKKQARAVTGQGAFGKNISKGKYKSTKKTAESTQPTSETSYRSVRTLSSTGPNQKAGDKSMLGKSAKEQEAYKRTRGYDKPSNVDVGGASASTRSRFGGLGKKQMEDTFGSKKNKAAREVMATDASKKMKKQTMFSRSKTEQQWKSPKNKKEGVIGVVTESERRPMYKKGGPVKGKKSC